MQALAINHQGVAKCHFPSIESHCMFDQLTFRFLKISQAEFGNGKRL